MLMFTSVYAWSRKNVIAAVQQLVKADPWTTCSQMEVIQGLSSAVLNRILYEHRMRKFSERRIPHLLQGDRGASKRVRDIVTGDGT